MIDRTPREVGSIDPSTMKKHRIQNYERAGIRTYRSLQGRDGRVGRKGFFLMTGWHH